MMSLTKNLAMLTVIVSLAMAHTETKKEEHKIKFGVFREDCFETFL